MKELSESFIEMSRVTNILREPALQEAINSLKLPTGSRGLDTGCSVGRQTMLLADAVSPSGHVTGLDMSSEVLDYATRSAEMAGYGSRTTFVEGDIHAYHFKNDTFDWAWSSDCIGYAPITPRPLLRELARVVRPGGIVAILAWSSENLLPGYPELEARLHATAAGIAPFTRCSEPESHFLRALGWFRDAKLEQPSVRTFAGNVFAPLSDDLRSALDELFAMRWPNIESDLSQRDRDEYRRLCLPDSPDYLLNSPDYYSFFTYSMFFGYIPR
jgi:ubiquinone/menaquinone biosynthesis C-methylase UbiE